MLKNSKMKCLKLYSLKFEFEQLPRIKKCPVETKLTVISRFSRFDHPAKFKIQKAEIFKRAESSKRGVISSWRNASFTSSRLAF